MTVLTQGKYFYLTPLIGSCQSFLSADWVKTCHVFSLLLPVTLCYVRDGAADASVWCVALFCIGGFHALWHLELNFVLNYIYFFFFLQPILFEYENSEEEEEEEKEEEEEEEEKEEEEEEKEEEKEEE